MNTTTWKTTLWRAARTFVQAALACIAAGLTGLINSGESITKAALGALAVSAISAGIAALMNLPQREAGFELADGMVSVLKAVESIDELPMSGQRDPDENISDSGKETEDNE